jgi:hypothetical protein
MIGRLPTAAYPATVKQPQDGDPRVFPGLEHERVTEVQVECDPATALATAQIDERAITRTGDALLRDRGDVMPGRTKQRGAPLAEVLVELDPHADSANAMSTKRSRDISAP